MDNQPSRRHNTKGDEMERWLEIEFEDGTVQTTWIAPDGDDIACNFESPIAVRSVRVVRKPTGALAAGFIESLDR